MKYFVVSHNLFLESELLEQYWELGWEIGLSRVHIIKKLLNNEIINDEVTIVTLSDRMFLYSKIFKNVLSYENFLLLDKTNLDVDYTLVNHHYFMSLNQMNGNIDKNNIELINLLLTTDSDNYKINEPFYLIHYRERIHGNDRNITKNEYISIIKYLQDNNIDFYIYGRFSDNLAKSYGKNELTLKEANSYMKNDKCKGLIGPLSGGSMIALLSCKSTHHIIDVGSHNNNIHILFHGDASNINNSSIINYKNVQELIKNI